MEKRKIEFIPKCLAVSFKRKCNSAKHISGDDLFKRFVNVNEYCYWNINLKEVLSNCELVGHIRPYCLLIGAEDIFIQSLKLAHQKRLLKAPESYSIHFMGDVDSVNCSSVAPSQFVSLDEALCYVIFDLNLRNEASPFDVICCRLAEWYPGLQLPPQFLILATLRNLIDSGQVYYTGYGYNIMTTDRMFVAQWLGEHGPEEQTTRTLSSSDISSREKIEIQQRSKSDRVEERKSRLARPAASVDAMHVFQNSAMEDAVKRTKTRSAVRQFFSKLRPGHHKPLTTNSANIDCVYDDDSNYYAFLRSQPIFYSSTMDYLQRLPTPTPRNKHPQDTGETSKPQWLWRTSLQSLPIGSDSMKKSTSSYSHLSTKAIQDESPPQFSRSRKGHRSKSRNSRNRSKHSMKMDRLTLEDTGESYPGNEIVQEDSGVHSISGSNSRILSGDSMKPRIGCQRQESSDRDDGETEKEKKVDTSPLMRENVRIHHRLSRSFSTRLSSISGSKTLDPLLERSRWEPHDDKHVAFKDTFETAY